MRADPADPLVLALPDQAGIHEAVPLAVTIAEALARNGPVRIETSATQQVDLATLQILVAAHRQAARGGMSLQITVPTGGALACALADYGFLTAVDADLEIAEEIWTAVHAKTERAA